MKKFLSLFLIVLFISAPLSAQQRNAPAANEVLIRNATVLTAARGRLEGTDILIRGGKIAQIGKNLRAGANAQTIDATGKFVTPGIIDAHSHAAIDGSVNEGSYSVTSMTRVQDVVNPNDINLYRALAGGVTALNILHGSANSIGGQNATIKAKWRRPAQELFVSDALPGIKFALGENPKRSHSTLLPGQTRRYPATRMGVEETIRDAFVRARDYKAEWDDYREKSKRDRNLTSPRRDMELEPLVEIMEGKRLVHAHGYRSDEFLQLLHLADEFGFKVRTLQHGLEAYKIAPEIARHGAAVSIFVDNWGYKVEAFDAIPYNAAILHRNGVSVSINSDSSERHRRLNLEAAKTMKYGDVSEEEALKMITLNAANQLGMGHRTGSIEVGKDADIVIWSAHPFSPYAHAERTMIEGETYFSREQDLQNRAALAAERQTLERDEANRPSTSPRATQPAVPRERTKSNHDDHSDDIDGGNNK
ncbi:MAG: amidohydrolase family protein [Acidobacteriota bacterium]|nr:amidohydrolase family protein [Acidobacteriota bacterium]